MEIWKEDPINSFRTLLRKLDNDYEEFDNSTQKLINKTFTKSLKDNNVSLKLKLKDEEDKIQDLPTGKEKIKSENEYSDNENSDEEIQISFTKDVLPYVIPLTCILTIKNSNMDFVKMLNDIKENPELLDIFDDQCLLWWNKKDLIDLIKDIVNKYFDKNSNTFNISVQFKMSLQSLIDNPKELLELINDCLKPKEVEKKENGEVFTPMILVNEMLDKLPKEIWKDKNLKWLDPCCGMGNFPIAVYLRLMEGLKDEIKDIKERKKHILENMLYMYELNKKNVSICKQIFNINNELKLNIYEGDSLKVDYNKQFDIIIGNPPYNASGTKATGNTLWQKFVLLSFKLIKSNGYITLIHPSGWRKPMSEKGKSNNLFDLMTSKNNMIYLEMHDSKDGMKTFNCGTKYDWYVINIKNTKNNITEIIDEKKNKHLLNLKKYSFLPNSNIELFNKIYCKNQDITNILYSRSSYGSDKKWISKSMTCTFEKFAQGPAS
jgi:hypothetical protein